MKYCAGQLSAKARGQRGCLDLWNMLPQNLGDEIEKATVDLLELWRLRLTLVIAYSEEIKRCNENRDSYSPKGLEQ